MEGKNDYFPFMTEQNTARITCLIISCLGIIFGPIVLYSIIWFERFGSDKKRTLLNMLFSMTCWTALIFIICIQIPDTFRYIYGPLPSLVCSMHLFMRYTLGSMFMLFIRHLQHESRICSCRIVYRENQNYDKSYRAGRIVNTSYEMKRLTHIYVVYSRIVVSKRSKISHLSAVNKS